MNFSDVIGYMAGGLSVLAYVPYIQAVIRDRHKPVADPHACKPKRASWLIWLATSWIIISTMKANASVFAQYQAWAYAVGCSITVVVACIYGVGGWTRSDRLFLGMALFGLVLWWQFHSAWYAFALAMMVDAVGILPVIKARGEGEDPRGWTFFFLGSLSNVVATFGMDSWDLSPSNPGLADLVYPWSMTTIISWPFTLVWRSWLRQRRVRNLTT